MSINQSGNRKAYRSPELKIHGKMASVTQASGPPTTAATAPTTV